MTGSHDRLHDGNRSRPDGRSFAYDLLAWFPIGVIVGRIGLALIDGVAVLGPVSRSGAIVVVLSLTVGIALPARDFDPGLLASVAFYVIAALAEVMFVLAGRALAVTANPLSPWETVGVRSLAAVLAALIVFTVVGRWGRRWVYRRLGRLLKLPSHT